MHGQALADWDRLMQDLASAELGPQPPASDAAAVAAQHLLKAVAILFAESRLFKTLAQTTSPIQRLATITQDWADHHRSDLLSLMGAL